MMSDPAPPGPVPLAIQLEKGNCPDPHPAVLANGFAYVDLASLLYCPLLAPTSIDRYAGTIILKGVFVLSLGLLFTLDTLLFALFQAWLIRLDESAY